jgi:ubiquinone/menaquinone biosynthesis C-methylase UbiE
MSDHCDTVDAMTKHHPTKAASEQRHDYLPAAGHDAFLPFYDLLTAALGAPRLHRTLLDQAGLVAGQRVLEIGCGTGNLSLRAKKRHPGVDVVASDPDPLALARAQRKARNLQGIRFERGYAQRLPYPDTSFDRVLSALMLHHLDRDTKAAAAAEVFRVLRPGGSLHVVDFAEGMPGMHGFLARRMASGHLAGADDLPRLLGAAGLECVKVASHRHRVLGEVTYYRATRPA